MFNKIVEKGYIIVQPVSTSYNVEYSHSVVNESNSTATVITRKFDNYNKKLYVLSESYFDNGFVTSKLSESSFVKKLKTRKDILSYVKNSATARFDKMTETQTYTVYSTEGYVPSLATPLYENVYVIKMKDDSNVESIKHLGKFKIQ